MEKLMSKQITYIYKIIVRIECLNTDEHRIKCKNLQITNNHFKLMEKDLKECWAWGIDLYTRKNILLSLPEGFTDD